MNGFEAMLILIEMLIIVFLISTIAFYLLRVNKSFDKVYFLLSKNESVNSRKVLNDLFLNLINRTNTEFAISNSKIGKLLLVFSFFSASFSATGCLFAYTYIGRFLLFLLTLLLLLLPEIYVYSKKLDINKLTNFYNPESNLFSRNYLRQFIFFLSNCFSKFANLAIYNFLSFCSILFFSLILQQILHLDPNFRFDSAFSDLVNTSVNTTIFYDSKPLELVSGNKFSFSGILFTLGVGGTVIFSLVNYYHQQNEMVNRNISRIKIYYQKWFELNKSKLSFDPKKYDEFNNVVNILRREFHQYAKIKNYTRIYKFALILVVLIYMMGLFVIIGSDFIVEFIFKLFPPISFLFFVILLSLFTYLDDSPSQQTSVLAI